MFRVSIFGCGGRIISLINDDLCKVLADNGINQDEFLIVAIYDPNFLQLVATINDANFLKLSANSKIYTENEEQVYIENEFDVSIIASRNDQHYCSLILANKYNKNIFCEKPVVNSIEQVELLLEAFKDRNPNLFFQIGLTLRYSTICEVAKQYLCQIGDLKIVEGCELVNIGHGGQIIMKNWRRQKSISGGLGLEKCVHDYDLIFHLIESVFGIPINHVKTTSKAQNTFWIESLRDEIMGLIESDKELRHAYHKWDNRTFQRIVDDPFDNTCGTDLIPDQQQVLFKVCTETQEIPINFDISIGSFRTKTERWYKFYGDRGECLIDIINLNIVLSLIDLDTGLISELNISLNDSSNVATNSHAGGDYHVMRTLVDLMKSYLNERPYDCVVEFSEAIRSTVIGCLAEKSIEFGEQVYLD